MSESNSKVEFFRVNKSKPHDKAMLQDITELAAQLGSKSEAIRALIRGGMALYASGELHQTIGQMKDKK